MQLRDFAVLRQTNIDETPLVANTDDTAQCAPFYRLRRCQAKQQMQLTNTQKAPMLCAPHKLTRLTITVQANVLADKA